MNQNNTSTTSLSLASYLNAIGYSCAIIKQNPSNSQLTFSFNISEQKFEKLSDYFWSKKITVDPLSYFEALKVLKSRIYQNKYKEKDYENKINQS